MVMFFEDNDDIRDDDALSSIFYSISYNNEVGVHDVEGDDDANDDGGVDDIATRDVLL